jgi:cell division protease FtsH
MSELIIIMCWILTGFVAGIGLMFGLWIRKQYLQSGSLASMIASHFYPKSLDEITFLERQFPIRVRADLQRALDQLFEDTSKVSFFCSVGQVLAYNELSWTDCLSDAVKAAPPQYEEINVGDEQPTRCVKNGLWLLREGRSRYLVFLAPAGQFGRASGMKVGIATVNNPEGVQIAQLFFRQVEKSVQEAKSYRGKILSLEQAPEHLYSGQSTGIKVHRLKTVNRDQVILPPKTLRLLERNVIQFARRRSQLSEFRQTTKKGLLFYGRPGTGKTHTIHYLAQAMEGYTMFLITAEQVGLLTEYMEVARLLQPSVVVIEDVDLIARDRTTMGVCEEVVLNKLLNEMDGLKEEADILFILTTNRPEALEQALASRPGRIDQAIEFPLPDNDGRGKLIRLYGHGMNLTDDVIQAIVERTERVSAAFIRELMRRSVQFHLERNGTGQIELGDVENALEEILFSGGSLNLKLLGAEGLDAASIKSQIL